MKKYLYSVIIFTVLLLLINGWFYSIINEIYIKDYNDVDLEKTSYLLADSRGVPLGELDKYGVENLSIDSDSYFDMNRKLNFVINNSQVDTIYISLDDHTLSKYREDNNNTDLSVFYLEEHDFESYYAYFISKYVRTSLPFFNSKYQSILKEYFKAKTKKEGKKSVKKNWDENNESKKIELCTSRLKYQFPSHEKSDTLSKVLEQMISNCKLNKIELIGIRFPVTKIYYDVIGDRNYKADSIFISNGLKILDYKAYYLNKEEVFLNQDHLRTECGPKFASIVFKRE